jgi:hypothetical protein
VKQTEHSTNVAKNATFVALKQMYYLLQQNYLRVCRRSSTFAANFEKQVLLHIKTQQI